MHVEETLKKQKPGDNLNDFRRIYYVKDVYVIFPNPRKFKES